MDDIIIAQARKLGVAGEPVFFELIKTGNINRTFLCGFDDGKRFLKYIVQRVNGYVFKDPVLIMDNIAAVTTHLRDKYLAAGIDPKRLVLEFLCGEDGRNYCFDDEGNLWRAYYYVDQTQTYDVVPNAALLTGAGAAFGNFMNLLDDFDMTRLHETIPNFHNTAARFAAFEAAVAEDKAGRAGEIPEIIDYIFARRKYFSLLVDQQAAGLIKTRVTHNDTKYNNVLIDIQSQQPMAIIDLDTVMPGLAAYDFGDAIRFAANTSAEDEPDTSKTGLSLEYYEAFTKGYVGEVGASFSKEEILSLPEGALMMTLELVMRFATDYLQGDPYFKINYPEHNLVRTRCQFALAVDMEEKSDRMKKIALDYYK